MGLPLPAASRPRTIQAIEPNANKIQLHCRPRVTVPAAPAFSRGVPRRCMHGATSPRRLPARVMAQPNSSYHATQQLGELQTEPLTSGAAPSSSHQPAVAMPAPRPQQRQHDFQVVKETQLHRRYLSVLNRTVRFTDDRGEVSRAMTHPVGLSCTR